MSTRITVTSSSDALLANARQVQQANREAQLQKQRDARTTATAASEAARAPVTTPVGGNPNTAIDRRPAAQRTGDLLPFAITWRGVQTPNASVPETISLELGLLEADPPSTFTYAGGDALDPSPIRFATSKAQLAVPQIPRSSGYSTTVQLFNGGNVGSVNVLSGFWVTEIDTDTELISNPLTPVNSLPSTFPSPLGPLAYSPSPRYLAVDPAGSAYVTIPLPAAPVASTTFSDRNNVFYDINNFWRTYGTGQTGTGEKPTPVLFLKLTRGQITSKTVSKATSETWPDFFSANCFDDDPGKNLRTIYLGEVRIKGNVARILRLRLTDEEDIAYYEDFPFAGLSDFVAAPNGKPIVPAGVWFEEHGYTLPSYSSDAELSVLLSGFVAPGQSGTPPTTTTRISLGNALFNPAFQLLGNDPGDIVTPNTYFVYRT